MNAQKTMEAQSLKRKGAQQCLIKSTDIHAVEEKCVAIFLCTAATILLRLQWPQTAL